MNNKEQDDVKADYYKIFYNALNDEIKHFKGEFWDIVRLAPDLFELFIRLATDPDIPPKSKPLINATITYFVVPHDILPEDVYGAIGYLDDLFLCAWSLNKLKEQVGYEILEKHWDGEKPLNSIIEEVLEKTHHRIQDIEDEILEFVGLG